MLWQFFLKLNTPKKKPSISIPKHLLKNIKTQPHTDVCTTVHSGFMCYSQEPKSSWVVVVHVFNPSSWEAEAGRSL